MHDVEVHIPGSSLFNSLHLTGRCHRIRHLPRNAMCTSDTGYCVLHTGPFFFFLDFLRGQSTSTDARDSFRRRDITRYQGHHLDRFYNKVKPWRNLVHPISNNWGGRMATADTAYGNPNTDPFAGSRVPLLDLLFSLFSLSCNLSTTNFFVPFRSLAFVVAVRSFSTLDTAGGRFDLSSLFPFCLVRKIQ